MVKTSKELHAEYTEEYESAMAEQMRGRIALLKKERDVKLKADLRWTKPEFEYQNTDEYLETIRENIILNTRVEIIKLNKQLRDVELNSLDRIEQIKEMEELKGNL